MPGSSSGERGGRDQHIITLGTNTHWPASRGRQQGTDYTNSLPIATSLENQHRIKGKVSIPLLECQTTLFLTDFSPR